MQFLSNGDFGFPFTWPLFWAKQFFTWSFQAGALNIDGIMRMPARLVDLIVFMMFGNLGFEYFFIVSSMIVIFVAFFYFCRIFLKLKRTGLTIVVSLFFTVNPIVLGNISKIGLIFAAAMLPLSLVVIHEAFSTKRFRYFILWLLFLNISLIHPFTFFVNVIVSGLYCLYQIWSTRSFNPKTYGSLALTLIIACLLNAYCLLPLVSLRTVDKGILSNAVIATPTDYTALVDVLNTGDILTGLSLSKNVVKDYDFYNGGYQAIYFFGVFGFYAILLGLYIWLEKQLNYNDRRRLTLFLLLFLTLVLLATVMFLHMDLLIKILINLPGGWAFRSPLKWQLYIPMVLFGILAILLNYVKKSTYRMAIIGALLVIFVCVNSYLLGDIARKLLTPRSIVYFSSLQTMALDQKNLLMVTSSQCDVFEQTHSDVMSELNQILQSKNVQVKQVDVGDIDQVDLSSYAYVLSCQETLAAIMTTSYDFKLADSFVDDNFQLYTNTAAKPYVFTEPTLFTFDAQQRISDNYRFVTKTLGKDFIYTSMVPNGDSQITTVQDIFSALSFKAIHGQTVTAQESLNATMTQQFYSLNTETGLQYAFNGSHLQIGRKTVNGKPLVGNGQPIPINAPTASPLQVNYTNVDYDYKNLIRNPSLEQGLWQSAVDDCYRYDNHPIISMRLNKQEKTVGQQSLRLEASSHIACTNPADIKIKADQQYLLSFDYRTTDSYNAAGYAIHYDNSNDDIPSSRLQATNGTWRTYTTTIIAPGDAATLRLIVQAYPNAAKQSAGIVDYDNFQLSAVPKLQNTYYIVTQPSQMLTAPPVSYHMIEPTKATIHVSGAQTPFYLATHETYSSDWQLTAGSMILPKQSHIMLNGMFNGWYIDPVGLCSVQNCHRHADGSYDLDLTMEFTPQRWFYIGSIISASAFIGCIIYLIREQHMYHQGKKRAWRIPYKK